jgi:hypothetical protein
MAAAYRIRSRRPAWYAPFMRLARLVLVVLATALGGLGASGCKADAVRCEQAVRNYATLVYWYNVDKEVNASPVEKRDTLRKRKLGEFDSKLENNVDMAVSQCQSANNDEQIDCMIAAKTGEQALLCTK